MKHWTAILCALIIFSALPATAQSIPGPTCIGDPGAPLKGIYLHGLFAAKGAKDVSGFRALEFANRKALAKLAAAKHVRIAAPVAPEISSGGMREWNNSSLGEIEYLAEHVCGDALENQRSLIGFSNGGFKARDIGEMPCSETSEYKRILAIGTQESASSTCSGRFVNVSPHVFPPKNLSSLSGL